MGHEADPGRAVRAHPQPQLRFRALPVVFGVVVALLAIFFTLTGNIFGVFILLPLALMLWFYFLRPFHRRRYRAAIAELPRWELRADYATRPAPRSSPPSSACARSSSGASRACPRAAARRCVSSTTLR